MPLCPVAEVCDPAAGRCVCDATCGHACGAAQRCDADDTSPSCGHCTCDPSCTGACVAAARCDGDPASPTCGLGALVPAAQPLRCGTRLCMTDCGG